MTNLIATVAMALNLSTNWTGYDFNGQELGYVLTNHVAMIRYQNETHTRLLKSVQSSIAVWRPKESITNYIINPWRVGSYTNIIQLPEWQRHH